MTTDEGTEEAATKLAEGLDRLQNVIMQFTDKAFIDRIVDNMDAEIDAHSPLQRFVLRTTLALGDSNASFKLGMQVGIDAMGRALLDVVKSMAD